MYFATQAANICDEKANHRFYRQYKHLVRRINRDITWLTARGKNRSDIRTQKDGSLEVLEQIADELEQFGYKTNVYTRKSANKRVYNHIETVWGYNPTKVDYQIPQTKIGKAMQNVADSISKVLYDNQDGE